LLDAVRGQLETLAVKTNEFDAFDERLRTLHSGVADTESRMDALSAKDKNLIDLAQTVDGLSKRFEVLFAQADDLTTKQLAFDTLHERLAEVDDLSKKTTWQMDALRQSRDDLDALHTDIQNFYGAHAEAAKIGEKLTADRMRLEAFGERLTAFSAQAPELEA